MVKSLVIVIVTRGRCDENDDDDNDDSSMYTSENIDRVDNLFTLVTVGSFIWTFSLKRNSLVEKSTFVSVIDFQYFGIPPGIKLN